jgi:hypothetical protein
LKSHVKRDPYCENIRLIGRDGRVVEVRGDTVLEEELGPLAALEGEGAAALERDGRVVRAADLRVMKGGG